jgi:hypothetical protein
MFSSRFRKFHFVTMLRRTSNDFYCPNVFQHYFKISCEVTIQEKRTPYDNNNLTEHLVVLVTRNSTGNELYNIFLCLFQSNMLPFCQNKVKTIEMEYNNDSGKQIETKCQSSDTVYTHTHTHTRTRRQIERKESNQM